MALEFWWGLFVPKGTPEPIRAKLDAWRGQSREATAHMHAIERWRERLIENDAALTEFANEHPGADLQAPTVRQARSAAASICSRRAGVRAGEGVSSISFW